MKHLKLVGQGMGLSKTNKIAKAARIAFIVYALALTAVTVLALTVGPFKDSVSLWVELRSVQRDLREAERGGKSLEEERERLLQTIKSLRADWASQQETIRSLREAVKDPDIGKRLVEANEMVSKLNRERAVLLIKLGELRQQMNALTESREKSDKQ